METYRYSIDDILSKLKKMTSRRILKYCIGLGIQDQKMNNEQRINSIMKIIEKRRNGTLENLPSPTELQILQELDPLEYNPLLQTTPAIVKIQKETKIENFQFLNEEKKEQLNQFINTFNARYINIKSFSEDEINQVKSNIYNPILLKLFENMQNLEQSNLIKIKYIDGPYYFCAFHKEINGINKTFYIFGEKHKREQEIIKCPKSKSKDQQKVSFADFIKFISTQTPSFTDIYVERSVYKRKTEEEKKQELSEDFYDIDLYSDESLTNPIIEIYDYIKFMKDNPWSTFEQSRFVINNFELDKVEYSTMSYTLDSINNKLKKCNQISLRNKVDECKLIRIHHIDARFSYDKNSIYGQDIMFQILSDILVLNNHQYSPYKFGSLIPRVENLIEFIKKLINPKDDGQIDLLTNIYNVIITNPNIEHELRKTYFKQYIIDFIKTKINNIIQSRNYIKYIKKILRCINNSEKLVNIANKYGIPISDMSKIDPNSMSTLEPNYKMMMNPKYFCFQEFNINFSLDFLLPIRSFVMDMYALCRIFKLHKAHPEQPIENSNIIIYAGGNHAKNYTDFLDFIGANEDFSSVNTKRDCIRLYE